MAFELIKPKIGSRKLSGKGISITKNNVTLSPDLVDDWSGKIEFVKILLDVDSKQVGVVPIKNNDGEVFRVCEDKKTGRRYIQSKVLLRNGLKVGKINMHFDKSLKMYIGRF